MILKKIRAYSLASLLALSLLACVDNAFDLSDIDSTIGVKINDLVVPLHIDEILLQSMIDVDDGSQLKEIDGEYAFLEEGSFRSAPIEVPPIVIPAPKIAPIKETLDLVSFEFNSLPLSIPDDYNLLRAEVNGASTSFNFEVKNIDPSLVRVDEVGANFLVKLFFSFNGLQAFLNSIEIEDLVIQLPRGFEATVSDGGSYNKNTGRLSFTNTLISDAKLQKKISFTVSKIDAEQAGLKLVEGDLSLNASCVLSAKFAIYGRNLKEPIDVDGIANLKKLSYQLDINFPNGDIEVTDFSGDIRYQFEGIKVSPVVIDNLPDLLNQEGTDIRIVNPQIYLSINNPLYDDYQLLAKSGIALSPTPKSDLTFKTHLTFDKAMNQFCLSPLPPQKMYVMGATHIPFDNLGNILSGNRIPDKIDIEVVNSEVPQQTVRNFQLGQNLGTVVGNYLFYAPLAMTTKAQIHYTDTLDGWSDDELDRLIVDNLVIDAKVKSTIPFGFKVVGYPIDKSGNRLTKNGKPIEAILQSVGGDGQNGGEIDGEIIDMLPPLANTSIMFVMEGPLKGIDGILVKAILSGAEGNLTLKPNQKIQFADIKLRVTGEYMDEL